MFGRDSGLALNTRNIIGISGNVFERMASGLKVRAEQQDSSISKNLFHSGGGILHYVCGIYSLVV